MAIIERIRERIGRGKLLAQEEERFYGRFIEIYEDHVDVYVTPEAAAPAGTIWYSSEIGCRIRSSAIEITSSASMRRGVLFLDAYGYKTYVVRKTPDGGAEVEKG